MKYDKTNKRDGLKSDLSTKSSLAIPSTAREMETEREKMLQRILELEEELNEVDQVSSSIYKIGYC